MNAVFLEATDDPLTLRTHQARGLIYGTMRTPNQLLVGAQATPADVITKHTAAGPFDLFSGSGHGAADSFKGQFGNVYDTDDTKRANYTVQGAIVHLYSCECGKNLGPHLVRYAGAKAFIGYKKAVATTTRILIAEQFVRVSAVIDQSILAGDTAATTKQKADAEAVLVDATLLAMSGSSPHELAAFRLNQKALVGPWSHPTKFGAY